MTKYSQQEKSDTIEELKGMLKPGDMLITLVTHVSKSGMTRDIRVFTNDQRDISYLVAKVLDKSIKNGGVRVGGCGMDMGFHVVYTLSSYLFHNGFTCTGVGCPSNDHSNGDRDFSPHHHNAGGYALRQRWL